MSYHGNRMGAKTPQCVADGVFEIPAWFVGSFNTHGNETTNLKAVMALCKGTVDLFGTHTQPPINACDCYVGAELVRSARISRSRLGRSYLHCNYTLLARGAWP